MPTHTPSRPSVPVPGAAGGPAGDAPRAPKPKLKKIRLFFILAGLSLLAMVSTVFGMMMAVASDLPALENQTEFQRSQNSRVYADGPGREELARLTGNENRILIESDEISPNIKDAVISIEDQRFYEHEGVDYKGIARALVQDVAKRSAAQGGSTITQQFVKNALAAQADRSVFQKLREAALAYHLERKWDKQKVLTQYLNSVYFGNGAYGIEAAVRTYFGRDDQNPGDAGGVPVTGTVEPEGDADDDLGLRLAVDVTPAEAAFLAGVIASPSLYDPVENRKTSKQRRDLVLDRMLEQELITELEYREALAEDIPTEDQIDPPRPDSKQPYFTSWLTQQLVDRYRAGAVFSGGLEVDSTIDPEYQAAAEQAIAGRIAGVGPSASLVAIENKTGEIKAMVGGSDFDSTPFNLATYGHRQPGSAFKPFILVRALADGVSPLQTFTSQQKIFPVPNTGGEEKFVVNNYEDQYAGVASLTSATANSDNSVFAELGLDVGTKRVARLARRMGIRTEVSTNPAMTLGGLEQGLTPLEMAYAYSTIANKGIRVSGTLDTSREGLGPVAIEAVKGAGIDKRNEVIKERVFPESVGENAHALLGGVVAGGTGTAAQIGEFAAGKTGTTENYGDAWFAGFNEEMTVAVWVGYPDEVKYMETEYAGGPVAGGTYPTEIWHDFMAQFITLRDARRAERGIEAEDSETLPLPVDPSVPVAPPEEGTETAPAGETPPKPAAPPEPEQPEAPPTPAPEPDPAPAPEPTPAPVPTPAPEGGGGAAPGAAAPG